MKNKSALTVYSSILVCLIWFFSSGYAMAQERGIYELTDDNEFSKAKVKKNKQNNRDKFYDLALKLHTTAYVSNNKINKVHGEGKVKKISFGDTNSFGVLSDQNLDQAELIMVTVNKTDDLNKIFDLTANNQLTNLKFVFVKCSFKCTKKQIKTFVKVNKNSKIRIFYRNESPS